MLFRNLTRLTLPAVLLIALSAGGLARAADRFERTATPSVRGIDGRTENRLAPDAEEAMKATPRARVGTINRTGLPTFIHGEIHHFHKGGTSLRSSDLLPVLQKVAPMHRLQPSDLRLESLEVDRLGFTHAKYRQTKNGLPVVGARLSVHVDKVGLVYAVAGNARNGENISAIGLTNAAGAIETARGLHQDAKRLKPSKSRLVYVISTRDESMHLAHEVEVSGTAANGMPILDLVYVDANSGEVVDVHSKVYSALNRTIYAGNPDGSTFLARSEGQGLSYVSEANINYDNLGNTYNYYASVFGRDSYDGQGGRLISTVNFEDPYGGGFNAVAFWSNGTMSFGTGGSFPPTYTAAGNMALALDVTAHELTHGVTESTSRLVYANEPGALNEAMSDIMGASCEAWVRNAPQEGDANMWKIGEDIFSQTSPGFAFRYMDNPTADGQSSDFYPDISGQDAHYASGVANLAYKLLVSGGQHPRVGQPTSNDNIPFLYVPGIGRSKAEQIFFRANTVYMGPGSHFIDARQATVQAASDLYGGNEAASVNLAWDAVGVPSLNNNTRLINISTRAYVGTEADVLIAGFVLAGGGSAKSVLVRGVGPGLAQYGVPNVLPDPMLDLYSDGTLLASNNDWSSSPDVNTILSTTSNVGAFPLANPSQDAAVVPTLGNGAYSAIVSGNNSQTGVALVEVMDTDPDNTNRLSNISSRAYVGTGGDILIAGFIVAGEGSKTLLIRGLGPRLSDYGVSGALPNPKLELYSSNGTMIRQNDNWEADIDNTGTVSVNQIAKVAAFSARAGATPLPAGSVDSVMVVSVPAGAYSVQLKGVNGATGVGLIEVFVVP